MPLTASQIASVRPWQGRPNDRSHREWPGKFMVYPRGECRWCGRPLLRANGMPSRKSYCNRACRKEYDLRADPRLMRRYVYHRDMGICQACGAVYDFYEDDGWEADHIRPLWAAQTHDGIDWSFWDPDNVQLLCKDPCHKAKTRVDLRKFRRQRDIVERRRVRRNRVQ